MAVAEAVGVGNSGLGVEVGIMATWVGVALPVWSGSVVNATLPTVSSPGSLEGSNVNAIANGGVASGKGTIDVGVMDGSVSVADGVSCIVEVATTVTTSWVTGITANAVS
jgi:hypothetical protein